MFASSRKLRAEEEVTQSRRSAAENRSMILLRLRPGLNRQPYVHDHLNEDGAFTLSLRPGVSE